ncbi:MAG: hypothetical protein OHK0029_10300 [Armatimonadaceae bacterium]
MSEEVKYLYPVALNVTGKRCVVVGGGSVGARKAGALWEAGAVVVVVAPEVTSSLRSRVEAKQIEWIAEPFAPTHLDGAFLVVAATDIPAVNAAVRDAAHEKGILLNLAAGTDEEGSADHGDYISMATVRRGELLLAVGTGGAGPALSARLRRKLEAAFGPEWADYVALLGKMREAAKAHIPDPTARTAALRRLAEDDGLFEQVMNGDSGAAWEEALECLLR